jgi:hypothetical protein
MLEALVVISRHEDDVLVRYLIQPVESVHNFASRAFESNRSVLLRERGTKMANQPNWAESVTAIATPVLTVATILLTIATILIICFASRTGVAPLSRTRDK